jgi:hypothetical protein
MYYEIIKIIDPEKISFFSKEKFESKSSFSSSSNSIKVINNKKNLKLACMRSNSQRNQKKEDIK